MLLKNLQEQIKNDWANSLFVGELGEETLQRNASALGQAMVLEKLMTLTYEEMIETMYD